MHGRSFTEEFKKQAVELAQSLGSVAEAARQLGVNDVNIRLWKKKLEKESLKEELSVTDNDLQDELSRLRKENAELKKVNHILKAAAAFFSQDHLK